MRSVALLFTLALALGSSLVRADSTPPPATPAAPAKGTLTITVGPLAALIMLDNKVVGSGEAATLTLSPGIYRVALWQYPKRGHLVARVRPGETTAVRYDFQAHAQDAPLVVGLRRDGALVVDGEVVTRDLLEARFRLEHDDAPAAPVVIAADKQLPSAVVSDVIALARRAGLTRISLAVARDDRVR